MAYGVTSTGFAVKPLSQIIADLQAAEVAGISASLNLQPPDPIAILTGIFGAALSELWLLAAALYNGMDPDQAAGDQLAGLALLTGTVRLQPTVALVVATVNVNAGFNQAPGTMFATLLGNPSVLFTNQTAVVSAGGGNVTVNFVTVNPGAQGITTIAPATLTIINQPIAGWNTITNASSGIPGSDAQQDPGLRSSRQAQLSSAGSGSAASLKGQVLKYLQPGTLTIPNVQGNPYTPTVQTLACSVLWNDLEVTDANGLPPHSIEVIAYAPGFAVGDDKALCALILAYKAAGITTNGGGTLVSQSISDSQGTAEAILATRPTPQVITVAITVKTTNPALVTAQMVKDAITTYVAGGLAGANPQLGAWQPGSTAFFLHTQAAAFNAGGVGAGLVVDVTAFTMNGGVVNISATARQVNTLAFGAVVIT